MGPFRIPPESHRSCGRAPGPTPGSSPLPEAVLVGQGGAWPEGFPLSPCRGSAPTCSLAGPPLASAGWRAGAGGCNHLGSEAPALRPAGTLVCPFLLSTKRTVRRDPAARSPLWVGLRVKDQTTLMSRQAAVRSGEVLAGEN